MMNFTTNIDDKEHLRRFISMMNNSPAPSPAVTLNPSPASPRSPIHTVQSAADYDDNVEDPAGQHDAVTDSIDKGLKMTDKTAPNSPELAPAPSPHVSGLRAPQNTPQTRASSPRIAPSTTHDEDVGIAISDFVNSMEGRPLSQSIWAPKANRYQPSPLGEAGRSPSRNLTPVKVVQPNPAMNQHFTRMSFKAADTDAELKHGDNIFGDRVTFPSRAGNGSSVSAMVSSHNKLSSLEDIEEDAKSQAGSAATNENHTTKPSNNTDYGEKEILASSSQVEHLPPHLRPSVTVRSSTVATTAENKNPVAIEAESDGRRDLSKVANAFVDHLQALARSDLVNSEQLIILQNIGSQIQARAAAESSSGTNQVNPAQFSEFKPSVGANVSHGKDGTPVPDSAEDKPLILFDEPVSKDEMSKPEQPNINDENPNKTPVPPIQKDEPVLTVERLKSEQPNINDEISDKTPVPPLQKALPSNAKNSMTASGSIGVSHIPKVKPTQDDEDREHKAIFNTWPKLEDRGRSAAQVRMVTITKLPHNATASLVASLVYGGPLEEIYMREDSADVRFLHATDCQKYYDGASNGIVYGKDDESGRELWVNVHQGKDVNVVGGLLRQWIDGGVTRCVRVVGLAEELTVERLWKFAERKERKVEKVVGEKIASGTRAVIFRFCKLEHAVAFKAALMRRDDWEHCAISYSDDPCATATDVHLEN